MPLRVLRRATVIVAALIWLACDDGAMAAAAHKARPPLAARGPAARSPGPPPGPGYCWYYIDRSTRAPGFWDMCRER